MSYFLICPVCLFKGDSDTEFEMNMTDECFCPDCGNTFEIDTGWSKGEDNDEPAEDNL